MQNISLNVKPLSAKGITLLVFGIALIAIPALTQSIINLSLIALNIKLSLPTTIALLQNMTWLNLIPKIVGLSVVSALIIRSHLKVDSTKTKRQITKVSIIGLTALMFVGALVIETPVASAQATALTGYILDTPLPIADWYIGTYGTGNYFAINGSNWDNLMRGVGSTAWAAYATNYTKVEELVLASVTSGSVYLKDVPFDLALMGNIPENVQVECNYQGVTYKYINSASSLGSPYTISVGQGPNAGYYLAQDSGDRICFTSTDALYLLNKTVYSLPTANMLNSTGIYQSGTIASVPFYKGEVKISAGDFVGHTMIQLPLYSQIVIKGAGVGATRLIINNTGVTDVNSTNAMISYYQNTLGISYAYYYQKLTITDLVIDTSQELYLSGITTYRAALVDFENLIVTGNYGEYTYGFHPANYSATPVTYGIWLNNTGTNGPSTVSNVYICGYATGLYPNTDHLVSENLFITDCSNGILTNGGYDWKIIKPQIYLTSIAFNIKENTYHAINIESPNIESPSSMCFYFNGTSFYGSEFNINNPACWTGATPILPSDNKYFGGSIPASVVTFSGPDFGVSSDPLNRGLAFYYPFDEGAGTTAYDAAIRHRNGTITGASYVAGVKGYALSFGGSGKVDIGLLSEFRMWNTGYQHGITYTAWVYYTGTLGANMAIIGGNTSVAEFRLKTDGSLQLLKAGTSLIATSNATVAADGWHHVAVTYTVSGDYNFYIDGIAAGSGNNAVALAYANADMTIGVSGTNDPATLKIDNVRGYGLILNPVYIQSLYAQGL